jgi:hypothetical protein
MQNADGFWDKRFYLRHQIAVEERAQNVSLFFAAPREVLLVRHSSIRVLNGSVFCHSDNRHAQIDTKRVHIEESKERHHYDKVSATLPKRCRIHHVSAMHLSIQSENENKSIKQLNDFSESKRFEAGKRRSASFLLAKRLMKQELKAQIAHSTRLTK